MKVDWAALLTVSVVSVVATVVFVVLLSIGVRTLSTARLQMNTGGRAGGARRAGFAALAAAGALVLYGLYLMIPVFH